MAYHIVGSIAANNFADSTDQSFSFNTSFTGSTANTQTTLNFNQTADQTLSFPSVPSPDTLLVTGTSGISQSLSNFSISSCNIISLTTPLSVPNGGTGVTSFPTNSVLVGNGTSAISNVSLTAGQILIGTGATPVAAQITQGVGSKVTSASGSITLGGYNQPAITKTSYNTVYGSGTFTNTSLFLPSGSPVATFVGSSTIPANSLASGDVIYFNLTGSLAPTTAGNITFALFIAGTQLHSTIVALSTIGTYTINVKAAILCGPGGVAFGQIIPLVYTGSTAFVTNSYAAPTTVTVTYSNNIAVDLRFTTSSVMTFTPAILNVYINKGS